EYFPASTEEARKSLSLGPLRRPRESLLRNFVIVLLKWALSEELRAQSGLPDWTMHARVLSALAASQRLHPDAVNLILKDNINVILRKVEDKHLELVIMLLLNVDDIWQHLATDVRVRLENYVSYLPELGHLDSLLNFEPLAMQARKRLGAAT